MILTMKAEREGYAPGIHYCPAEPMLNFRRISVRSRTKACFYIQRTTPAVSPSAPSGTRSQTGQSLRP